MANDDGTYPYLIPLIWQFNANTSPGVNERATLYSVSPIPHAQWGGIHQVIGGGAGLVNSYTQRYNQVVAVPPTIEIELNFETTGMNLDITANIIGGNTITPSNTRVIFILTYNFDAEQTGDYFASVVRYATQAFNPETAQYTQSFALNNSWNQDRVSIVVIVQNTGTGAKTIHNAQMAPLNYIEKVTDFHSFSSHIGTRLVWEPIRLYSNKTVLGYNVYRDDVKLNLFPILSTTFTDYSVSVGSSHEYTVSIVFTDSAESVQSDPLSVVIEADINQLGSGSQEHGNQTPGPINVFHRSHRGQFVYTAEELRAAGITRPGFINGLGFYVTNGPSLTLPNYTVKMKPTSASSPEVHDNSGFEVIHEVGNYQPMAGNWDIIEFETPFFWDGVENVLIDTGFGMASNFSATGRVRTISARNGYRFIASNSENVQNSVTTTLQSFKPQIRLLYTPFTPAVIHPVQNFTGAYVDGSIYLSWQNPSVVTNLEGFMIYRDGLVLTNEPVEDIYFNDSTIVADQTYTYSILAIFRDGASSPVSIEIKASVSDSDLTISHGTRLIANYPNPFNPTTAISFMIVGNSELGVGNNVQIEIFNIRGQKVRNLINAEFISGEHTVVWDGTDDAGGTVSSGVYLYKLTTEKHQDTKKMILMK
jgi:hypothetical protein